MKILRSRRKQNSNTELLPTLTLTPLIDTVLVLLIIFMVTIPAKVPTTANAVDKNIKQEEYRVVTIDVNASGSIFINGSHVKDNQLANQLNKSIKQSPIKTFLLRADLAAPIASISKVTQSMRRIDGVRIIMV